ncbi:spondin domain-containing protein [Yeosuana sp. MJ-SS3]|uniref:Spondin domain-containing protein n=1 Tax=Gilvirhabdus luticola TaxID=3079858 RepID=A0ABU3U524_9FLAO|nr:spondin domain-containing protein [Yeosuana sp. MJ-SS3]MDU8885417.1 spondin domain-containing protein [Yeosuana sp. MJ-SS3]
MKKNVLLLFLGINLLNFQFLNGQSIATYDITFTSVWNSSDHGTLPNNPHWSNLVGATHNNSVTFFELNQMASLGIKDVAEEGINTEFMNEVNTAISNSYADQWLQQSFSSGALGSATLSDVKVSEDFPLLTLVSMIAPSPDWFIGLNGYSLLDMSNEWKTSISMDMFPTDAGTDSGVNYESPNEVTTPQGDIISLQGVSPFNSNKIGTLTITLVSVLNTKEFEKLNKIGISPNPSHGLIVISSIQEMDLETIEVYNILGKMVNRKKIDNNTDSIHLNLESQISGLYLLKFITVSGESTTKKLVIK